VIPTLEIGGAERQMTLLLNGLDLDRYCPAIVCCKLTGALVGEVPANIPLYDLGKRSRWDFPFLVFRLRRILAEFRPEFIIASMEYAAVLSWLANRLCSQRASLIARKEVMPSQARLGESFRRSKRVIDGLVDRRVDMIVAPSRGILKEFAARLEGVGIPMVQIPNAVDLGRLPAPGETGTQRPGRGIVAMGRFVSWKRFDLLISALAHLPRGAAELHLIGDGPERESLQRLAGELGVSDCTHFYGYHPDPFPILKKASIGVLPSQFEPFGNVIIEMFAAGLPVVAFDVDYGPREIIRDGENGILVRTMTSKSLAGALETLLKDAALRSEMGAKARLDAEQRYALPQAVRSYEACFTWLRDHGRSVTAA